MIYLGGESLEQIELVAIDVDGTLIDESRQIRPRVRKSIEDVRDLGVKIVIATGRPLSGIEDILEDLNFYQENEYIIVFNGALAREVLTNRTLVDYSLNMDDYLALAELARTYKIHYQGVMEDRYLVSEKDLGKYNAKESYYMNMPLSYRDFQELDPTWKIKKFMFVDHQEKIEGLIPKLPQWIYKKHHVSRSEDVYLEVVHREASKGHALDRILKELNIDPKKAMAIGDNGNDIEMLELVGTAVAMENGKSGIKDVADYITSSNEEDGVAEALENFILKI